MVNQMGLKRVTYIGNLDSNSASSFLVIDDAQ